MSFLKNAAIYFAYEPHQEAAWADLESKLPKYLLEEFMAVSYTHLTLPTKA